MKVSDCMGELLVMVTEEDIKLGIFAALTSSVCGPLKVLIALVNSVVLSPAPAMSSLNVISFALLIPTLSSQQTRKGAGTPKWQRQSTRTAPALLVAWILLLCLAAVSKLELTHIQHSPCSVQVQSAYILFATLEARQGRCRLDRANLS